MLSSIESVDRLLGYLKLHDIVFDYQQLEDMTRLFCKCQGSRFSVQAFAGLLTIVRYSLMKPAYHEKSDWLKRSLQQTKGLHNVCADLESATCKLYEIFAAAYEQSLVSGLPIQTEFKNQLRHLAEFFTSCQLDPNEGDNL